MNRKAADAAKAAAGSKSETGLPTVLSADELELVRQAFGPRPVNVRVGLDLTFEDFRVLAQKLDQSQEEQEAIWTIVRYCATMAVTYGVNRARLDQMSGRIWRYLWPRGVRTPW